MANVTPSFSKVRRDLMNSSGAQLVGFGEGAIVSDLRSDQDGKGAELVGFGDGATVSDLRSDHEGKGAELVPFNNQRSVQDKLKEVISIRDFGADPTPGVDNYDAINSAIQAAVSRGRKRLLINAGHYEVRDTIEFPHDLVVEGEGAKNSVLRPHASFPFGPNKYIAQDLLNPGGPTPDNDFFCVRRNFGVRATGFNGQVGCYWARPGGGSKYSSMYLADAYQENTLRISGGADGGASVAAGFENIWLANSGGEASPSRVKNGLFMEGCYSLVFNNLIVDYQSNDTDYNPEDFHGYGIHLSGCVGIVFNGINAEGNSRFAYLVNSQGTLFNGGAVYRKGLGSAPSTDPDFLIRVEESTANMPGIINMFAGQGYLENHGGGLARLRNGMAIPIANRNGYFSYFNENNATLNCPTLIDPIFAGASQGLHLVNRYFSSPNGVNDYRAISTLIYSQNISSGTSGTASVPLLGGGDLVIVLRRNDATNAGYAQVIKGLVVSHTDAGQWLELGRVASSQQYDKISAIQWTEAVDGLSIAFETLAYNSTLEVYFLGSTRTAM